MSEVISTQKHVESTYILKSCNTLQKSVCVQVAYFYYTIDTGCERYNVLFAVGGIAQRLRWDHYIDLGGLDNDLGGIDNGLACQK